jgi:hypothetical protein
MSVNKPVFPGNVWDGTSPRRDSRLTDAGPEYEDHDQIVAEVISMQQYILNTQSSGAYEAEVDTQVEIGTPIYLGVNGHINPAQADTIAASRVAGVSLTATLPSFSGTYTTDGQVVRNDWTAITGTASLTPGADYFLDPDNLGRLTAVAPTAVGEFVVRVGKAQSPTVFDVEISPPIRL